MAVVLEIVEGAASEHDVCQDVTTEAVEHGTEPGGHGTPAGNLHRPCNTHADLSGSLLHLHSVKLFKTKEKIASHMNRVCRNLVLCVY